MKKSLQDLTKRELLTFIYNNPPGDINIFDNLADCFVCGTEPNAKYGYECESCQKENEEWHKKFQTETK